MLKKTVYIMNRIFVNEESYLLTFYKKFFSWITKSISLQSLPSLSHIRKIKIVPLPKLKSVSTTNNLIQILFCYTYKATYKNLLLAKYLIIALIHLAFINNVYAAEKLENKNYYIRLDAGLSEITKKHEYGPNYDKAEFYGFGFGYIVNQNFRTDLIFTNRSKYQFSYDGYSDESYEGNKSQVKASQNLSAMTLMLNAYYTIPVNNYITPYINGGLGVSRVSAGKSSELQSIPEYPDIGEKADSTRKYNLAWNLGVGTQLKFNNNFSFDVFFRYIDFGKSKKQTITCFGACDPNVPPSTISYSLRSYEIGTSLIYRF